MYGFASIDYTLGLRRFQTASDGQYTSTVY